MCIITNNNYKIKNIENPPPADVSPYSILADKRAIVPAKSNSTIAPAKMWGSFLHARFNSSLR